MAKIGIMAYGTQRDRDALAVLATIAKKSSSEWLIAKIRAEYKAVFGDQEPRPQAFKNIV
jgi:hypothetical protein